MEPARASSRAWSRRLWMVVTALTAIGLVGAVIDFLGLFAAGGHGINGGCGGFGAILLALILGGLVVIAGLGVLAALGLVLFGLGSRWGPMLLIVSNLMVMAFYGWVTPVYPGQVLWAVVILGLAATPAIAGALVLWPLLTRGRLWVRIIELLGLALIALPLVRLYTTGLAYDVQTGMTPLPSQVTLTASGCGGGG